MKLMHYSDVEAQLPTEEGVKDVTVRWLIKREDGADNFAMRLFEMAPGGHTPYHQHDWEHEVFIVEGRGVLVMGDGEHQFKREDFLFVPPNDMHQFKNTGDGRMRFLCLVPYKD